MVGRITEILNNETISFSLEITPDITEHELEGLELEPKFFSITWHAQTHECKNFDIAPLKLAKYLRDKDKNVLLHISCCYMRKNYLNELLMLLQDKGICNLFIILGENFDSQNSDFGSSRDMIIYIRQRTGNYFCIGVAGFPGREENILFLKAKVDCGADFILTQAFFKSETFKKFTNNCREVGINVPIIPGIYPFETEKELQGFVKLCKVDVEVDIAIKLSNLTGIEVVTGLVNELIQEQKVKHFHFFTLNKLERIINSIRNIIV